MSCFNCLVKWKSVLIECTNVHENVNSSSQARKAVLGQQAGTLLILKCYDCKMLST
jgi:hypothetical protein